MLVERRATNSDLDPLRSLCARRAGTTKPNALQQDVAVVAAFVIGLLLSHSVACASDQGDHGLPNVLLIMVDDVGFSDLGCYGGEIDTTHLDGLAQQGVRFSNFLVNPMCVVTRTSLMTGHTHSQSDNYRRSLPVAKLMRKAGYSTSLVGKWHQPGNPLDAGFDSFYGFLGGAINSWTGKEGRKHAIQNDRDTPLPVDKDWYATDAFTDRAMHNIRASVSEQRPFFAYVAYNAPHTPLHAPRELVEKYYRRYEAGWDELRQRRFEKLQDLGIIDDRYTMVEPGGEVRRWREMPRSTQLQEARRMAAYAGMLERVDWNVGRLLNLLDEQDVAGNTLVVFLADNGGAYSNGDIHTYDQQIPWEADSMPFASNGWSFLKNTPFRWYKSSAYQGGVSVPCIMRWPAGSRLLPGEVRHGRFHVTDLYPTLLDITGQAYPSSDGARRLEPLYGHSMMPTLEDQVPDGADVHDEIFWSFNQTSRGLILGDWKIVSISDGPWSLFNIKDDPTESQDLASSYPRRATQLSEHWFRFAQDRTTMPASWREPPVDFQEGWGFHRLRMVLPGYVRCVPAMAAMNVSVDTDLQFHFDQPVSFRGSEGKTLRLYRVPDPQNPVWESTLDGNDPSEGSRRVTFPLPQLAPKTTYYLLADPGWITVGGRPAGPLNDGAYWYRFRTK
ncbi:MAG: sulfatase-like hydrolase/transferase [Planctomycetota bacterium]